MSDQDKPQEPLSNEPKPPTDISTEATLKVHELLHWIENNRPKFLGAMVTIAVLIAAWIVMDRASHSKELRANAALTDEFVMGPSPADSDPEEPDPAVLASVAQEFSGTDSGVRALLFSGLTYFEDKQYAEAKAKLQEFSDAGGSVDPFVAEQTRYAIGVCHEALGELTQAQAIYQALVGSAYPTLAAAAQYSMGRLKEEEGDLEAALAFYDGLVGAEDLNLSHWSNLSTTRRLAIYEERPDLEPEPEEPELPVFDEAPTTADIVEIQPSEDQGEAEEEPAEEESSEEETSEDAPVLEETADAPSEE